MTRTWTPDRRNPDGTTTMTMKIACSACGRVLGDATSHELAHAIAGLPTPSRYLVEECGCTRSNDGREVHVDG